METLATASNVDRRVPARVARARLPPLREGGAPRRIALFAGPSGERRLLEMVPAPEPPARGVTVDDPHVLSVRSFQAEEGGWALVEYVGGARLSEVLALAASRGGRLPVRIAARIVLDACEGLAALHERGMVHGAVSPRAIVVGGDGVTRVLDPRVTEVRAASAYLAPEQADGAGPSAASDVFSIAVVAWEALTGQRLFRGLCDKDTQLRVRWAIAPAAGAIARGVPLAIDLALARALAKEPEERTGAVRDFALEIGAAASEDRGIAPAHDVAVHLRALLGMAAEARRAVVTAMVDAIGAQETLVSAELDGDVADDGSPPAGEPAEAGAESQTERTTAPSVPPPTSFAIDQGPDTNAAAPAWNTPFRGLSGIRAPAAFVGAAAAVLAVLGLVAGTRGGAPPRAAVHGPAAPALSVQTSVPVPASAPASASVPVPAVTATAAPATATATAAAPTATAPATAGAAPSPPRPARRPSNRLPDNPY